MKLPTLDSATFRALVTFVQAALGVLVAGLASPDVVGAVVKHYPEAAVVIPTLTAIVTFLWNAVRSDVKNY